MNFKDEKLINFEMSYLLDLYVSSTNPNSLKYDNLVGKQEYKSSTAIMYTFGFVCNSFMLSAVALSVRKTRIPHIKTRNKNKINYFQVNQELPLWLLSF